jgi:ABC-2 type transport system ATP-binding protein
MRRKPLISSPAASSSSSASPAWLSIYSGPGPAGTTPRTIDIGAALTVRNLEKSYPGVRAVAGLSLTVAAGEFFGFLGPNGAGKTTTIRIVTGVTAADSGDVTVAGYPLGRREEIARVIGVVPESRGVYGWMGADEYLAYFGRLYGIPKGRRAAVIDGLLKRCRLYDARRRPIRTFSRGMQQRLALARALVNGPRLLFLDEPTLGLDPQGQEDIHALLREVNREGTTIFMSSHRLEEVAALCSRLAVLHHGRLVAEGTPDELTLRAAGTETYRFEIRGSVAALAAEWGPRVQTVREAGGVTVFTFEGELEEANRLLGSLAERRIPVLVFRPERDRLTRFFLSLTQE